MHAGSPLSPPPPIEALTATLNRSLLVVDDEDSVRDLLVRWLEASGYVVAPARNAADALSRLEASPAAVVICDIRMPGHDGLWLAARIRQRFPETAIIMASGVQDVEASIESLRQGVVDYLTKPFGRARLRDAVVRALEWHQAAADARRWREALDAEMQVLKHRLRAIVRGCTPASDPDVEAMLTFALFYCRDAHPHARRVADLAVRIAGTLPSGEGSLRALRRAALLHDLGKAAIPEALLRKPAPLTPEELAVVRTHPGIAADLLAGIASLTQEAGIIRHVHAGLETPLESRIISVADAFDAMTHPRVYRDAVPPADAMAELQRGAGRQFDPAAVAALASLPNFR